jgi:hypothetical protein
VSVWLLALLFLAQGQPAPRTGVIEGYVVREGTNPPIPLANARLELAWTGESFVVRTDFAGRFVFSNLPAARFRLSVTKDGYVRREYRAAAPAMPGVPIDLKAGQTLKDVVFFMEPAPTISGMIRDPQGGPLANILVQALRRAYDTRGNRISVLAASTRTDDRGEYRLYWLDPGEYFLSAERPSSGASRDAGSPFPPTYFPGFAEPEDAKPIFLELGRDAGGMDFSMSDRPFATVRVDVMTKAFIRSPDADVALARPEDSASGARYAGRARAGSLVLERVAPGSYIISAAAGGETGAQRIRIRNRDHLVRLTISSGVALNGSVFNAEGAPMDLRGARVTVFEADPALPEIPAVGVSVDNRFSVPGVQPGTYSLAITGLPEDLYVRLVHIGGVEAGMRPVFVSGDAPVDVRVTLGLDGGRVGGVVYSREDQPLSGAQVVLVPESESRFRFDRYRRAVSGEDGSFSLRGIAPGEYKLFAWDSIESNAELNAEYMRAYENLGTPVRIAPGENPAVPLRLIRMGR